MNKTARTFLGAATLGAVVSSLAFILPSFAAADTMVTGYQTGYSYHQGLANGDGSALMAQGDNGASTDTSGSSVDQSAPVTSDGTSVSAAPQASPVVTTQSDVSPVAPVTYVASETTQAATPSFLSSLSPANWAGIALIALAVIIGIVAIAAQPPRRTTTVTRSYQRYS